MTAAKPFHLFTVYVLFFSFYAGLACFRHFSLHSGVYDLGLFTQWSYLSGIGEFWTPSSLTSYIKPALGDHFSLLLIPIGILYRILPSAYTLLLLQSAGLALLAILFLRELYQSISSKHSRRMIMIGVLINPFLINSTLNDFHPEVAFSFLGLASLIYLRRQHYLASTAFLIFFMASKEAMAFFAIGYSIYSLLRRHYLLFAGVMVFALLYFSFSSAIVDAYQSYAISRYSHLGNSYGDILTSVFLRPAAFWSACINRATILYIVGLFIGFAALCRWPEMVPAVVSASPLIIANVLSQSDVMRNPIYQYQMPVVVFLMQAVLDSVRVMVVCDSRNVSIVRARLYVLSSVISFFLLTQWSLFPTKYLQHLRLAPVILKYEIQYSSPSLSIWSHERIASHFSGRRDIFYRKADLLDKEFDVLIAPNAQLSSPPANLLKKLRNWLFSYGDSNDFLSSEQVVSIAKSRGYQCSGRAVVICER